MNNTNLDRRTHARYLAPSFSLVLKSTPSHANHKNEDIVLSTLDFNRFGMAIESQHHFKIGDELSLVITDSTNRSVEVSCFVCNRAKLNQGYRSGLHFIEQSTTKASLVSLEEQLEEA